MRRALLIVAMVACLASVAYAAVESYIEDVVCGIQYFEVVNKDATLSNVYVRVYETQYVQLKLRVKHTTYTGTYTQDHWFAPYPDGGSIMRSTSYYAPHSPFNWLLVDADLYGQDGMGGLHHLSHMHAEAEL